jgi:predicted O-methyltransferase YrrM
MKKNLVYYSIGISDEYAEMVKLSVDSMDKVNSELKDVVILTDKNYFEKNFINYKRPKTSFHILPEIKNSDEACFNRLKIFEYNKINEYDNVMYLDADTIININLDEYFKKCEEDGKLYTVVEDYNIENHKRIPFGLGTYNENEISYFEKNNIYTFNSGTFMFKSSLLMKKHFDNVLNIIKNYEGEYFTDQSFLNYYFNSYNLTKTDVIRKDVDYLYIVESNYNEQIDYDNKILHVITESNGTVSKIERMKELQRRINGDKFYRDRSLWIADINKYIGNGKGVEIGVFKGEFSKQILKNWGGTLYMVDVWRALGDEYSDESNHANHTTAYQEAMDSIRGYEDRAIMIRTNSKTASEMFEDESLDFIFIDANHAYEYVVEDINLWFPKLKKGGMFSGHDYILMDWYKDPNFAENKIDKHIYSFTTDGKSFYNGVFGVNPAVDEFCEKTGYKVNYTGEWFATWWFIK